MFLTFLSPYCCHASRIQCENSSAVAVTSSRYMGPQHETVANSDDSSLRHILLRRSGVHFLMNPRRPLHRPLQQLLGSIFQGPAVLLHSCQDHLLVVSELLETHSHRHRHYSSCKFLVLFWYLLLISWTECCMSSFGTPNLFLIRAP